MIKNIIKIFNTLHLLKWFCFYLLIGFFYITFAQTKFKPLIGNYNSQPGVNGHVDIEYLLKGLKDLGADTYMWLINGGNDWEDLKAFLPKAEKAGMSVWIYLRPPTETPATGYNGPYSEPFKNDYISWAKAIAKLSLKYPNLTGYLIDDFWYNTAAYKQGTIFTTSYIKKMVSAGKSINPKIKFYPVLYFRQIDIKFIDSLSTLIDGVLAAYPGQIVDRFAINDSLAIVKALTFTNDTYQIIQVSLPESVPSPKGDYGFAHKNIKVIDPNNVVINFYHFSDRALGHFPVGYHIIQFRIDDKVVWSYDATDSNGTSIIDITKFLVGKNICNLSIGLYNNLGVSNYSIHTNLQILSMKGIEYVDSTWKVNIFKSYQVVTREGKNLNILPLIVMPPADVKQYMKRYNDPATPKNIAKRIETISHFLKEGKIEGIVTYVLNMNENNEVFKEVKKIFRSSYKNSE